MKALFRLLFNIVWIIFGGLFHAIYDLFMGVFLCLLIIPIFIGIPQIYFKIIPLSFAPAGRKVELNFERALIRNVLYLVFFGWTTIIANFMYGVFLCCTIIFIPVGIQQFKFAKYFVAPFGAQVV